MVAGANVNTSDTGAFVGVGNAGASTLLGDVGPNEYWVSKGSRASDANTGDRYSPFLTVGHALASAIAAAAPWKIHVGYGTFVEHGLNLTLSNGWIAGTGMGMSVIQEPAGVNDYVIYSATPGLSNITITDLTVDGNKANNPAAGTALAFQGTSANPITGLHLERVHSLNANGIGIGIGAATDTSLIDCLVENSGDNGIDTNGVQRITQVGNKVYNAGNMGFYCGDNDSSEITYFGCVAYKCVKFGFSVGSIAGQTVSNIHYIGCHAYETTTYDGFGEGASGTTTDIFYTDCSARNGGRDGFAPSAGRVWMKNCISTGNAGHGLQAFGSTLVTWDGGDATGNTAGTGVSGANIKASNVIGVNPFGQWQPGIPASGTEVQNNSAVDAWGYMTGGTVTAVAVGAAGAEINIGVPSAFRVPAGQYFKLTYSAAPTSLVFIGD